MAEMESARPRIDLDHLRRIKNGRFHDISKYKRPTIVKKLDPTDHFLLPILPIDVGPNNLFRILKQSMPFASEMNYTLAMPVFHSHPRMEKWIEHNDTIKATEEEGFAFLVRSFQMKAFF